MLSISDVKEVSIEKATFETKGTFLLKSNRNKAGIILDNVETTTIVSSTFTNMQSDNELGGGALYITDDEADSDSTTINKLIIKDSKFTNCKSTKGGAITISNKEFT